MSATEKRQDQAAALLRHSRESASAPPGTTSRRTDPVQIPAYLPPDLHRRFKQWALTASEEADLAEIPLTAAIRALIRILVSDDELSRRVVQNVVKER